MISGLDHVSLTVADPDAAERAYGILLAAAPAAGRRFQLDNTALEIRGGGDEPAFGLVFAAPDPDEALRALARRGLPGDGPGLPLAATHGVMVSVTGETQPAPPIRRADAPHAIDHVVIHTTNPERAAALYGARLGLDLRLDRANPQWGTRLLFFRLGGAVIEISAALNAPVSDGPDRITGLAWRVANPAAAQARLAAAGLDVSPVRAGRKPGTTVFTVRAGVPGAPALMLGGAGR